MNRVADCFDRSPADRVLEAAHRSEAEYAAAVRAAVAGESFDPAELLALGAGVGRPPYIVFADVRLAEIAFAAWKSCIPTYFG